MFEDSSDENFKQNLSYNLSMLSFLMAKASQRIYEDRGLTNGQWKVLTVVASFGPLSPAEIATRVTLDSPAISRASRQLRDLKFINYTSNAIDMRSVHASLTAKGRRAVSAMNAEMAALQVRIFDGVGEKNAAEFFTTAERLLENLRARFA